MRGESSEQHKYHEPVLYTLDQAFTSLYGSLPVFDVQYLNHHLI